MLCRHPKRLFVTISFIAVICIMLNIENHMNSISALLPKQSDSVKGVLVYNQPRVRKDHIVYVKIEKTGSSTMSNILAQYGMKHGINMMMSTLKENYINTREEEPGTTWIIGPNTTEPLTGHLMEQHGRFNERLYDKYFPRDTVYVASLREPASWFVSYVDFMSAYRKNNPKEVLADDNLFYKSRTFLLGLPKHVHNCFLQWLGFDYEKSNDEQAILDFIDYADKKFSLMLITEYFDESLVLLRRMMNWSFNDIFYAYANEGKRKSGITLSKEEKGKLIDSAHNRGDYLLYQHFNTSFWRKVQSMPDFWEEVALFRKLNAQALRFCNSLESMADPKLFLTLSTRWEGEFKVKNIDCLKMRLVNGQCPGLSDALDRYIPNRRQFQAGKVWVKIKKKFGYVN